MSERFVKYFEAQIGAMLMQVTCNSEEHDICPLGAFEYEWNHALMLMTIHY